MFEGSDLLGDPFLWILAVIVIHGVYDLSGVAGRRSAVLWISTAVAAVFTSITVAIHGSAWTWPLA